MEDWSVGDVQRYAQQWGLERGLTVAERSRLHMQLARYGVDGELLLALDLANCFELGLDQAQATNFLYQLEDCCAGRDDVQL